MDVETDVGLVESAARATREERTRGCLLSLAGFCAAMVGMVFFCAQAWSAMGPWAAWQVNGPLMVFKLPWLVILGDLALALLCGAAACGAFLLGSARTGLIAEREHPLMP